MELFFMVLGFTFAAYAVVANDALQTLGTFLASNDDRPWWVLWIYGGSIMVVALMGGWLEGDIAYGRLDRYPLPDPFTWIYAVPPLALLLLTRFGMPVSTTFLVLTVFSPKNLGDMVFKSGLGYAVAMAVGVVVYLAVSTTTEKRFLETADQDPPLRWVALQWVSTAWLWYNWLVQDLANIYVFLPRDLGTGPFAASVVLMLGLLGYTFYNSGGEIQKIVTAKTNTQDIRSATIIDFLFGCVLFLFKDGYVMAIFYGEVTKLPMSTTWVFLGLLGGRELAMTFRLSPRPMPETVTMVASDAGKAFFGLVVSVVLALALPWAVGTLTGAGDEPAQAFDPEAVPAEP